MTKKEESRKIMFQAMTELFQFDCHGMDCKDCALRARLPDINVFSCMGDLLFEQHMEVIMEELYQCE